MIKKKAEQHDDIGFTEWWDLCKNYSAVISLEGDRSSLDINDELRNKLKPTRAGANMNVIYPMLIKEYNLSKSEYVLDRSIYESGLLDFPTEKKENLLIMIDNIISKYSFFDDK